MAFADFSEKILQVQLLAFALVELLKPDFDFRPQLGQCIDTLQQLATELLLGGFRQFCGFRDG